MLAGIILIIAGVLILMFPELLSAIVAAALILMGISFVSIGFHYRRIEKEVSHPFSSFFFRF